MNKLIVVSGGTEGIGFAIVEKFLANGFDAVISARNQEKLLAIKQKLEQKYTHTNVFTFSADLSKYENCQALVKMIGTLNRSVNVLVNNTGVYLPGQVINEADGQLEIMLNTNLKSAYNLTRGLINPMIEQKYGHIFNICSIASITPYPNGGSYSISKYALYGMTKVLREELKPHNIRVTAVLPGATLTASWDGFADSLPPDRLMDPTDIAEMVFASYSISPRSVVEDIVIRPQLGDL
jgi:short-subunit dehydrogenase